MIRNTLVVVLAAALAMQSAAYAKLKRDHVALLEKYAALHTEYIDMIDAQIRDIRRRMEGEHRPDAGHRPPRGTET